MHIPTHPTAQRSYVEVHLSNSRTLTPPPAQHGRGRTYWEWHGRRNWHEPTHQAQIVPDFLSVQRLCDGTPLVVSRHSCLRRRIHVRSHSAPAVGYLHQHRTRADIFRVNPRVGYGTTSAYNSRYNPHLTYPADCHWNCKDLNRAGCYWMLWTSAHGVGETFAGRYGDPWTVSASTGWHAEGISWDTDAFIVWRRGTLPARELRQILWDANEYREAGYTREICMWDDEGNPTGSTLRRPNERG